MATERKRTSRATAKEKNAKASKRSRRGSKLSVPPSVFKEYPQDKWELQWINNEGGEIERVIHEYGAEPVEGKGTAGAWAPDGTSTQTSSTMMRPVGRGRNLDAIDAVLMAIPRDVWEDEKEARRERKQQKTQALKKGVNQSGATGDTSGGTYAPELSNGKFGYSEETKGSA